MSYFYLNTELVVENRFDMAKYLNYSEGCYDPFSSYLLDTIKDIDIGYKYTIQGEETRPDYISFDIYGTTEYWWVILLYNNLMSADDLKTGMVISCPSLDSLDEFYFKLKGLETAENNE